MNALAQRLPAAGLDAGRIQLRAAPVDLAAFAAHVRGDPGFPVMRDAVIQNVVQLFRGDYLLSRLMLEEGRYVTIQMLLTLAATQQAEERSTWLTLGRLQQSLAGSELASRNRIEALVAVLERYGFVERRKAEEDLRLTLLLPTARLWGADALFVEAMVQPLARLADTPPTGAAARELLSRLSLNSATQTGGAPTCDPQAPAWSTRDVAAAGAGHRNWHRLFAPRLTDYLALRGTHASIQQLATRDGGYMALLLLLDEARARGSARISLPYETLSNHTGISRTHARLLTEQAEACGFLRLHAKGGREVEVTEQFRDAADAWFASLAAFHLSLD